MAHIATHSEIITATATRRLPLRRCFDVIQKLTLVRNKPQQPACRKPHRHRVWILLERPSNVGAADETFRKAPKAKGKGHEQTRLGL